MRTSRFRQHLGVDPIAIGPRGGATPHARRIVSGGSTITMQVARLLEPRTDRTFLAKLRQAVRAIEIERRLSKDEILTLYLGLAPYGGNIEGTRAAALAYVSAVDGERNDLEAGLVPIRNRPDRARTAAQAPGIGGRTRGRRVALQALRDSSAEALPERALEHAIAARCRVPAPRRSGAIRPLRDRASTAAPRKALALDCRT